MSIFSSRRSPRKWPPLECIAPAVILVLLVVACIWGHYMHNWSFAQFRKEFGIGNFTSYFAVLSLAFLAILFRTRLERILQRYLTTVYLRTFDEVFEKAVEMLEEAKADPNSTLYIASGFPILGFDIEKVEKRLAFQGLLFGRLSQYTHKTELIRYDNQSLEKFLDDLAAYNAKSDKKRDELLPEEKPRKEANLTRYKELIYGKSGMKGYIQQLEQFTNTEGRPHKMLEASQVASPNEIIYVRSSRGTKGIWWFPERETRVNSVGFFSEEREATSMIQVTFSRYKNEIKKPSKSSQAGSTSGNA